MTNGFLPASTVEMLRKKGISPDCVENFFNEEGIALNDTNSKKALNFLVDAILKEPDDTIFFDDVYKKGQTANNSDLSYCLRVIGCFHAIGIKGKNSQFLRQRFFSILGYNYIDTFRDMREGSKERFTGKMDAEELADYIFENYALVGEYHLNDEEWALLLNDATCIFNSVLDEKSLTAKQATVLTLVMILLSRYEDDGEDDSFWRSIVRKLGLKECEENAFNKLTSTLRQIVKRSFVVHNRYLESGKESSNFKIPYTPMKLHALYPKESAFALFTILSDFYKNELDYQFADNDTATYKCLARSISEKQNTTSFLTDEEKVRVRSDKLFSGLCALFKDRKNYAALLCERIIKKIDGLLRGNDKMLDPEMNEWDNLLLVWFNARSMNECHEMNRRNVPSERIITRVKNVRAAYTLDIESRHVKISLPSVRLGEQAQSSPEYAVYSGDCLIKRGRLSCYGNEVTTVRAFSIDVGELYNDGMRFENGFDVRIRLNFNCKDFSDYDSGTELCKKYLVFNSNGNAMSTTASVRANDTVYIAYPDNHELSVDNAENLFISGTVIKVAEFDYLDNTSILYDNESILRGAEAKSKFSVHTSVNPASGVWASSNETDYSVFPDEFDVIIEIPEGLTNLHAYQVHHEGHIDSLEVLCNGKTHFTLHCSKAMKSCHISIVEFATGKKEYPLRYIIIKNFSLMLDDTDINETMYFGRTQSCIAKIRYDSAEEEIPLEIDSDNDCAEFSLCSIALTVKVPVTHCELDGKCVFSDFKYIWRGDLKYDSVFSVRVPDGYTADIIMDDERELYTTNNRDFQIGAYSPDEPNGSHEAVLKVSAKNETHYFRAELPLIYYSEAFAPTQQIKPIKLEKLKIYWQPEGLFIGPENTQFTIELSDETGRTLAKVGATTKNEEILCLGLVKDGWIRCRVSITRDDLFSQETVILFDEITGLGNPDTFMFRNKTIHLEYYRMFDEKAIKIIRKQLDKFTGYVSDIEFDGYSVPPDHPDKCPKYTAIIKYYNSRTGDYVPYKFGDGDNGINPIYFWKLDDNTLRICSKGEYDEGFHSCSLIADTSENRISLFDGNPIDDYTYTIL